MLKVTLPAQRVFPSHADAARPHMERHTNMTRTCMRVPMAHLGAYPHKCSELWMVGRGEEEITNKRKIRINCLRFHCHVASFFFCLFRSIPLLPLLFVSVSVSALLDRFRLLLLPVTFDLAKKLQ